MPNHITNIIKFSGDRLQIKEMRERIRDDELGPGTLDFNKLIPMPKNIGDNWYDWCKANWGTKWGAYSYDHERFKSDSDTFCFRTAWSAPHPVIRKLAEKYPDIRFEHEWADDEIGENCGRYVYEHGERCDEYFPISRKECIEFAARVMDTDISEYELYLNADGTDYVYYSDEEFEIIEIEGIKALFTNARMVDADVPKGFYCYHLRESDDGSRFCTLEKNVAVNHGGTVITTAPIDLRDQGFIPFNEENSPNFTGEITSMQDFIEGNTEQNADIDMKM